MILDIIKYSTFNLWSRRTRSALTILSILIGIAAIFALISFGQGINKYVSDFAVEMGSDKVMMMPGGFSAPGTSNIVFTKDDLDFIKKINGVDEAVGMPAATGKITFKDYKARYTYMFGMSTEPNELRLMLDMFSGIDIIQGRQLKQGDSLKVVLGYNFIAPNKMFKKAIDVGDTVEINDIPVEVVGFYEEIGSPTDDSQIYLSEEGFKKIFGKEDYEYIYIRSAFDQNPAELADKVKDRFRKYKGEKKGEEDFVVQTFEDALATFTSVINILNAVLVLIALISVVVAAVNIMNTMYTSILERTREIGVMKSVGARNSHILIIFMFESGLLGLVGGALGVSFGYLIAKTGGAIAKGAGLGMLRPYFPLWLTIGCLVFAFLVGAGSGLLPSRQASKLKPVDALRYE